MTKNETEDLLGEDTEALFCDGCDDAIIGIAHRFGREPVVAYDISKMNEKPSEDSVEENKWVHITLNKDLDYVEEYILKFKNDPVFYTGYKKAIIGIAHINDLKPIIAYDLGMLLDLIVEEDDDTTYEDALDHYYYNIIGGWVGEGTPVFVQKEMI